jgi:eukaryotic-like serine/threonine-protein kinase
MGPAEPGGVVAERYRLQAVIGRGGMGVVWLAGDQSLHRYVAVKEILWPPQLDAGERATLHQWAAREARKAAGLNHPNIVRIYDLVEDDGRPWVVMQFVPYRSLSDVVRDDGPLSPGRAAQVGLRIMDAIRVAHAVGVLHRKLKPRNVLLGPEDRVVLTGFGMAIADGSPTLTTSGALTGSPSYMAPERVCGEPATPAADLWSLGATVYAAVEGRPPFERGGSMAVLAAVVSNDPDRPRRAGPLWPVISGLLRNNPADRLDAAEVARLLRRVAGDRGAVRDALPEVPTAALGGVDQAPSSHETTRPYSAPLATAATTRPHQQAARTGTIGVESPLIPGPEPSPRLPAGASQDPATPLPPAMSWGRQSLLRWFFAAVGYLAAVAAIALAVSVVSKAALGHHAPSPTAPAPSSPSSPPPSGGSGLGTLPAGFTRYRDPTGFSIGVPRGWHVSHQGHVVYLRDPTGSRYLIVEQSNHPKPDPRADLLQQEASRISTYPGYHRIRLQTVHYAQAERAADWEFIYYHNGKLIHVLNRNILANAHHAYALYWSTPASEWDASFHLFRAFAVTFRPAGAVTGRSGLGIRQAHGPASFTR